MNRDRRNLVISDMDSQNEDLGLKSTFDIEIY